MSKTLSRSQTDEMSIAFAQGWRGPYGEQGAMEADFDKCLYSHELLLERVEKLERVSQFIDILFSDLEMDTGDTHFLISLDTKRRVDSLLAALGDNNE